MARGAGPTNLVVPATAGTHRAAGAMIPEMTGCARRPGPNCESVRRHGSPPSRGRQEGEDFLDRPSRLPRVDFRGTMAFIGFPWLFAASTLAFLGFRAPPHLGFYWLFRAPTLAFVGFRPAPRSAPPAKNLQDVNKCKQAPELPAAAVQHCSPSRQRISAASSSSAARARHNGLRRRRTEIRRTRKASRLARLFVHFMFFSIAAPGTGTAPRIARLQPRASVEPGRVPSSHSGTDGVLAFVDGARVLPKPAIPR